MGKAIRTLGLVASFVLAAGQAQAVSSLSFLWVSADGNTVLGPTVTITASTGTTLLRGAIEVAADTEGISGIFLSMRFDTDLGDELNIGPVVGAAASNPGGQEQGFVVFGQTFSAGLPGFTRNQVESTDSNPGVLGSFDMTGSGSGIQGTTRTVGSIFFTVNNANAITDGEDLELVILDDGFDDILSTSGANISDSVLLTGASVNKVPEPTSALLLVSGIAGLAFAGRRRA